MAEILVGTCGYHYIEWIGPVYPEGTKKEDFLTRYARMFSTVELDQPYSHACCRAVGGHDRESRAVLCFFD